ncbi:transcriptional repressor [Rubellicoccus peritrichatus]|uniref:Ferric uptake regulation protein n=1 Tax=Rubellicoccus peritrichatus TaxID=3080537 RepID=A0AAQ3LBN1_9BACT|nr:transcriptional repressor [Puniceicoccus sp. CR14]WOO41392.1 transcriptional repressor [Puniceicoccus sp. CR14]
MSDVEQTAKEQLIAKAYNYWRSKGSTMTVVRKIICEIALEGKDSYDAETLLSRVRQVDRQISLSTVYRTLSNLVEANVLREFQGPADKKHYTVIHSEVDGRSHVVCQDCNQIFPLEDPCLALREGALARQQGFSTKNISLRMEASCDQLHEKGDCNRKQSSDN